MDRYELPRESRRDIDANIARARSALSGLAIVADLMANTAVNLHDDDRPAKRQALRARYAAEPDFAARMEDHFRAIDEYVDQQEAQLDTPLVHNLGRTILSHHDTAEAHDQQAGEYSWFLTTANLTPSEYSELQIYIRGESAQFNPAVIMPAH